MVQDGGPLLLATLGSLYSALTPGWWWKLDSPLHSQLERGKERESRAGCSPSMGQNLAPGRLVAKEGEKGAV